MNVAERADFINSIEEKFPVDEWEAYGIKIWPVIRIMLYSHLREEIINFKNNSKEIRKKKTSRAFVKKIIQSLFGLINELRIYIIDYKNNDIIRQADAVFFKSIPKVRYGNKYNYKSNIYIRALQEHGINTLILQGNPRNNYDVPRHGKSFLIQTYLEYVNLKVALKLLSNRNRIFSSKNYQFERYGDFIQFMNGNEINLINLEKRNILIAAFKLLALSRLFENILAKIKPFVCFKFCYYDSTGMALNLACRKLNIASVDIQHGVQGEYHSAYGRWNRLPSDGYELLPRYFWCWGEEEVETINRWSNNFRHRHKAYHGGNLAEQLNFFEDDTIYKSISNNKRLIRSNNRINILYTMQHLAPPEEWLFEAICKSPVNWRWFIRLHPGMLSELEKVKNNFHDKCFPVKDRIELDLATNLPLPAVLINTDVHITAYSTCVLDAKYLNVPSVVISNTGKIYYSDLINSGWVKYASNWKELMELIMEQYELRNKTLLYNVDPGPAFIHNRWEKMADFLNAIKSDNSSGYH